MRPPCTRRQNPAQCGRELLSRAWRVACASRRQPMTRARPSSRHQPQKHRTRSHRRTRQLPGCAHAPVATPRRSVSQAVRAHSPRSSCARVQRNGGAAVRAREATGEGALMTAHVMAGKLCARTTDAAHDATRVGTHTAAHRERPWLRCCDTRENAQSSAVHMTSRTSRRQHAAVALRRSACTGIGWQHA